CLQSRVRKSLFTRRQPCRRLRERPLRRRPSRYALRTLDTLAPCGGVVRGRPNDTKPGQRLQLDCMRIASQIRASVRTCAMARTFNILVMEPPLAALLYYE